jgi:hypothetical protein
MVPGKARNIKEYKFYDKSIFVHSVAIVFRGTASDKGARRGQ